tara:strand:- start:54398 stop:55075 length:678 start_codon:yes stop_codon:yes gene_type:complete
MRNNVKNFNEYLDIFNDNYTNLYLESNISFKEWETNFDSLNENKIIDILQVKIIPILKNLKNKIKYVGVKGINILKKILNFIKSIRIQPALKKLLVTIIFIFIFGIVLASAATGSNPNELIPNEDVINAAIGFINDMEDIFPDSMDRMKTQAYLIDLKDNGIIDHTWSEKIKKFGDLAIKVVTRDIKEGSPKYFNYLIKFGEQLNGYIVEIFNDGTSVTLLKTPK